jgi:hypothetical protein
VLALFDLMNELDIELPLTPVATTPSGGMHIIFRLPPGVHVGNRTGKGALRDGVEVKGTGGYIQAAPSVKPRGAYVWQPARHPLKIPVADCPEPLLKLVSSLARVKSGPIEATGDAESSFLARAFAVQGWLAGALPDGKIAVRCPWAESHTDGHGFGHDSSTAIFPPTAQAPLGSFKCQHSHCERKRIGDVLGAFPSATFKILSVDTPPELIEVALRLLKGRS